MGEKNLNSNLAAEFYVLSMLYRMGAEAHLTLGNKKSVDIVVIKNKKSLTIDVKGMAGSTSFPLDNWNQEIKNHYIIFVSFVNEMSIPSKLPEVYIVPSDELKRLHKKLIYISPKDKYIRAQLSSLRKHGVKFRDRWNYFL